MNKSLEIAYRLLPAQKEFIHVNRPDVDLDVCLYQGGYGSGKTFIGSFLGIELSEKYPKNRGLVVALTYPLVRDTTLKAYFEHFDKYGYIMGRDYHWKASEQTIVFPNGSEILFRHLENPEKLKSLNLGWIHVEEMSMINETTFLMLLSRLRLMTVSRHRLFGTTNPQANKGWIYQYFIENKPQAEEEDTVIQYRRVLAPSTENVHLSKAYLKNMENQFDPDYYRINVLGQDGDYTAGLVCKTWSSANVDDQVVYNPNLRIYLTCDFNVDPMCWALAHRFNGEYHFFDELCIENTSTIEAVEEFYRRYPSHSKGVIITGDASGRNRSTQNQSALDNNYTIMRNRLSQLGMRDVQLDIRNANPPVESRTQVWNGLVCSTSGVRRVKVSPKCKWLVHNCENLKYVPGSSVIWEPTLKQIEQDPKMKFTKHIWDAASYLTERYDPIKLDPPKGGGPKVYTAPYRPR